MKLNEMIISCCKAFSDEANFTCQVAFQSQQTIFPNYTDGTSTKQPRMQFRGGCGHVWGREGGSICDIYDNADLLQ